MAEKKSGGNKKKIIIIGIALLLVVGVVLALIFFLPKGKATAEHFNEVCDITIADSEEAKADYNHFKDKVSQTEGVKYYNDEIVSLQRIITSVDEVADYYNDYYIFAANNNRNKDINDALAKIKTTQKALNDIMAEAKKNIDGGMTHVQNVWVDYRAEFLNLIKHYQKLFGAMNYVYHNQLANITVSNPASQQIFKAVDSYMNVFVKDIQTLVDNNIKGSKAEDYNLGRLKQKATAFANFVDENIEDRENIEAYYMQMPTGYDYIGMFNEKFGASFEDVIDSISQEGILSYTNEIAATDANAATSLATTKTFLLGGEVA